MKRSIILFLAALLVLGLSACDGDEGPKGSTGPAGPAGPPGPPADSEPTTAVETCIGCHGPTGVLPVGNILDTEDPHFIDTDPAGPATASGYRQIQVVLSSVDVTGSRVVIEFDAADENADPVDDLFASDGRFTIARLDDPIPLSGDSSVWVSLITQMENPGSVGTGDGSPEMQAAAESFTSSGGLFENLGGGSYRYSSAFDPTSAPVMSMDAMRVAIQISASDIPAGNGWCDFDADLTTANDCVSTPKLRDIVQTATCNDCHGVTSDVKLALHGGGRTDVEYCVTCHNPGSIDANSDNTIDFKQMIHKIHYGSSLTNPYMIYGFRNSLHDYSTVTFTKDIDDCTICHQGGGAEVENWNLVPTAEACGSCHDDVDFESGANHGSDDPSCVVEPGAQTNAFCAVCHPPDGVYVPCAGPAPVKSSHFGVARAVEASRYEYVIDAVSFDSSSDELTVDYRVNQDGGPMDLATAPEWNASGGASRLAITAGWSTSDYTNEGASAPASALSVNALVNGGVGMVRAPSLYRVIIELPSSASETVTVAIEGHPAADLDGDGVFSDRIAVKNVFQGINVDGGRGMADARRSVVDVGKCNHCHDAAGQGISLHGNNRTGEIQVCVVCHNPNNTDINRRPPDPTMALDGKKEETIDFKRLIHQIHSGAELQNGIVIYGFSSSPNVFNPNDFSHVEFIGNRMNCETCHLASSTPGSERNYGATAASDTLPSTIDTGADLEDPGDDLNISPTAAVCSACHDDDVATDHMKLHGASFEALDDDIL